MLEGACGGTGCVHDVFIDRVQPAGQAAELDVREVYGWNGRVRGSTVSEAARHALSSALTDQSMTFPFVG